MPDQGVLWCNLPEEVFEGKGDQWDVYRRMREIVGRDWKGNHLITNVLVGPDILVPTELNQMLTRASGCSTSLTTSSLVRTFENPNPEIPQSRPLSGPQNESRPNRV